MSKHTKRNSPQNHDTTNSFVVLPFKGSSITSGTMSGSPLLSVIYTSVALGNVSSEHPTEIYNNDAIRNAVYAHLQAIRALGKTAVSPSEVASALDLPYAIVKSALEALTDKGVRAF